MKDWSEYINPFLRKSQKTMDKIFDDFEKEKKAKNIKTTKDQNDLWKSKYDKKFKAYNEKHHEEYKKLWNKFHKK